MTWASSKKCKQKIPPTTNPLKFNMDSSKITAIKFVTKCVNQISALFEIAHISVRLGLSPSFFAGLFQDMEDFHPDRSRSGDHFEREGKKSSIDRSWRCDVCLPNRTVLNISHVSSHVVHETPEQPKTGKTNMQGSQKETRVQHKDENSARKRSFKKNSIYLTGFLLHRRRKQLNWYFCPLGFGTALITWECVVFYRVYTPMEILVSTLGE